ncbi:hypothetical protein MKW92_014509 [Papaver armeniacum]|nr:hypothetical protein MKW92_014509 [Papaver armeniacum]
MPFCNICMESKLSTEMRNSTINCTHTYCRRCIKKHIASKVKENITLITCPEFNCEETLEPHFCRDNISHKVFDRWESALRESSTPQVQHRGGDEDMLLIQLAKKKNWRKCPGCKYYVEKTMGCMHVTCRYVGHQILCGSEFCYGCGAKWSDPHEAVFLSVGSDDGAEEDVFPIFDEKYAEKLCLQEALMSSVRTSMSLGVTKNSSNPSYRKSEIGESSSSSLKIEIKSSNSNDTKMKSSMNAYSSAGDDQYSSENSFCEICMEAKPTSEMRKSTIKYIIPGQVFDRWENALCESLILASHKVYCPFKDCSAMLVNDDDGKLEKTYSESVMAGRRICMICMEAKPVNEMRNTTNKCSHSYCTKCIAKHIASKVQEKITLIRCPEFNCKERLEPDSCRDIISGAVLDRWEISLCESLRIVSDRVLRSGGAQDKLLIQLAEKKKWRQCGSEFCYGCGATWSKTHEAECRRV